MTVFINGRDLTVEQVIRVCRDGEEVKLTDEAIVNVKKISGSASVLNDTLYDYAKRDAPFLKRQVRDILQPNIVVCGGGSNSISIRIYSLNQ